MRLPGDVVFSVGAAWTPYFGPAGAARVGVQKSTVMNGFLSLAIAQANPGAEMLALGAAANAPGPYDAMRPSIRQALRTHGAYNVPDGQAPAPMLLSDGFSDDFAPADESVKLFNRIRTDHPRTPVAMFFGDVAHPRSQDKAADGADLAAWTSAWMRYYVLRVGPPPPQGVKMRGITCPAGAPSSGPYAFADWSRISSGEVRLTTRRPQTVAATAACTAIASPPPPAAPARRAPRPTTRGRRTTTSAGPPARATTSRGRRRSCCASPCPGPATSSAARLLDVGPDGQQTLVERGLLRPRVGAPRAVQVLQLHPNVWHVAPGHALKLELLPDDVPYSHLNVASPGAAAQHPIRVRALQLRVPVMQRRGASAGLVRRPLRRYLPPGYAAARDFAGRTTRVPVGFGPRRASAPLSPARATARREGRLCGGPRRPYDRRGPVTSDAATNVPEEGVANPRLSLLLAMAMFVLVVDTSLMNVSISAVVEDLDTTVSGVQSAIALEALVSAAFILISSKVGDLIGRKRAYVLGLLAYAVGAVAMTVAQSLTAIIVFWAIIGGLGASLLLPAMQSLIHGNFEGDAQKKTYALVGASAAIAAAVGPLLGGFVTTYLSWRVGFLLEVVDHRRRAVPDQAGQGRPLHGRSQDRRGRAPSCRCSAWAASCWGSWCGRRAASTSALLIAIGALALWALARWLVRRHREGKVTLLDPDLFRLPHFRIGITQQMLQQITLGGAMIALPIFLQITLEYNAMQAGLSLAPLSLTMFAVAMLAGRKAGRRRPASIVRVGIRAQHGRHGAARSRSCREADSGWYLVSR